jgi:hypothetical protein
MLAILPSQSIPRAPRIASRRAGQASGEVFHDGAPSRSPLAPCPRMDDDGGRPLLAQGDYGPEDGYCVAPLLGTLMNSALNSADWVIVPVDSGFYAMMGIKELLSEMEEIQRGTNARVKILGYLMTLSDQTKIAKETWDGLVSAFGEQVFETQIRRNVKLKEAPALGRTIFHHSPDCAGAQDYLMFAEEVQRRLGLNNVNASLATPVIEKIQSQVVGGGAL